MTVTSLNNRVDVYADGVQTAFNFSGFKVVNTNHLKVYLDGELQNSGYTVTLLPTLLGGTVTFTTTPADNVLVTLYREVPLTQETNLGIESDLSERSIENMSDKLTMGLQQLNEKIQRSLTLPISSSIQGLELPSPDAGMFLRWNATETALENADINITGGGVAGPSSSIQYAVAVFNSTTGLLIDDVDSIGVAGQALISNGPGNKPSFQDIVFPTPPSNDGFGGNGSRSLPTSGTISGDYHHSGAWTATGALNIEPGTRVFVKSCTGFDMAAFNHVVNTRPNSGGKGRPASGPFYAAIGVGSGPGSAALGAGVTPSVVVGPGGAGFGGRGGRGGSYADHWMPGGARYTPREFFGGTGGNSGMHYTSTATAAVDGGNGGGGFYLEIEMISGTCTLGNINLNGGAGVNAPDTNYSGSAGGSGGCFVARIRGTAVLPAGRTISVNGGAGGSVGSGGTANAAGGGGGAGVIDIEATNWTNSGTLQANGGAAGSGGSYTATAGENSTPKALGLGYNPSKFF